GVSGWGERSGYFSSLSLSSSSRSSVLIKSRKSERPSSDDGSVSISSSIGGGGGSAGATDPSSANSTPACPKTSVSTSIGTSLRTARAIASLGRASISTVWLPCSATIRAKNVLS